jgi:hypothetical protein
VLGQGVLPRHVSCSFLPSPSLESLIRERDLSMTDSVTDDESEVGIDFESQRTDAIDVDADNAVASQEDF